MPTITGKRRLIFGLACIGCVSGVEAFVPSGWSMYGHIAIIAVAGFFYGERAFKKLNGGAS